MEVMMFTGSIEDIIKWVVIIGGALLLLYGLGFIGNNKGGKGGNNNSTNTGSNNNSNNSNGAN